MHYPVPMTALASRVDRIGVELGSPAFSWAYPSQAHSAYIR